MDTVFANDAILAGSAGSRRYKDLKGFDKAGAN